MAMAGGACSAYKMSLRDGRLSMRPTTTLRSECVESAEAAAGYIINGGTVTVAGTDATAVRRLIEAHMETQ